MKVKISLTAAVTFIFLAIISCSPFTLASPTAIPTFLQPTISEPTQTETPQPTPAADTPTIGEPTFETATSWPTSAPQPAAPAHLALGTKIQLDEVHMFSLTEGWGISGSILLKTLDGGQTWREVTPEAGQADTIYGAFLDSQTAWLVFSSGGQVQNPMTIFHTTDRGSTWITNQGPPITPMISGDSTWAELAAWDAQNVWVMVRGVYMGAGTHYSHELFKTSDGGATWTSLDGETSDGYTGMVFADTTFGVRTIEHLGAYENWAPSYDSTTDGGVTWENHELPPPPGVPDLVNLYTYCETYQPILLSATSIHMLVGCFDYYNPPQKFTSYIYSSQDGGTTWNSIKLPAKVQASLDELFFFDANNALLMGRDIYKSTNGGQTWTFVQTVNWDGKFSFIDPLHGWGVVGPTGEVALVSTSNGGRNWALIKPVTAP